MKKTAVVHLEKESMKFSCGHFTIFSATEREALHGHNFSVEAKIVAQYDAKQGLAFDYRVYKEKLNALCDRLDRFFLLPTQSPYLQLREQGEHVHVTFNQKTMSLLAEDVILMPLPNITVEELSGWLVEQLVADKADLDHYDVQSIWVRVFTLPGQSASSVWERPEM